MSNVIIIHQIIATFVKHDFVEDNLNNYIEHARYVDLLSRPDATYPVANAGTYSLSEIEGIRNAANDILQTRLKETRNLYQQRAHSVAYALDEELKERKRRDEKFVIVTHSSAETALALQSIIDDHKIKIEGLPVPDKTELTHPAQRQKEQIVTENNINQIGSLCQYSEIRRNVKTSLIYDEDKEESIENSVEQTIKFILDILDTDVEPTDAYIFE
uniref:Uncharacterized protein n=1 Tax=Panagrolaimus sp. PS1159 TaxID=55785 RepID=A0AC35GBR3_9BILA